MHSCPADDFYKGNNDEIHTCYLLYLPPNHDHDKLYNVQIQPNLDTTNSRDKTDLADALRTQPGY